MAFTWVELEAATKYWRCTRAEALERLLDGETCIGALEALAAHSFAATISKWEH